jgi:hypothetical protein
MYDEEYTLWISLHVTLLILLPVYFLSLSSNYSPQHLFLKDPKNITLHINTK